VSATTAPLQRERLAASLRARVGGEVRFDRTTRGLYATDASIYQIQPIGVVIPRDARDIDATIDVCAHEGVPVLARGGGTSQCGQTVGEAVVVDTSKYLREIVALDVEARTVRVQPGIVLAQLNAALKPHGLFFPVDPSTANRATIGGMTANNSSGARSIRYGNMVHNVRAIDAVLADGTRARFDANGSAPHPLVERVRAIARRERAEIDARFPKVLRRVGGYNLDLVERADFNPAQLLVGSEGTLAFFTEIELALQPLPRATALGVCHFPRFYDAMAATKDLVTLGPVAVELVDATMLQLARSSPVFGPTIEKFVRGEPGSILLVEFAGDDPLELVERLAALDRMMASLGFAHSVVPLPSAADQTELWGVRSAGLNIMTSMKGDAKPVSIIEDCAVPLEHLAAYTDQLNTIFANYGTVGTWYAHASVGCLHVRPVLNVKSDADVRKLRAIAEEAFALVRQYGGSHSGEHGDGIVRSEFHREMFGDRLVTAFEEVKDAFDPHGVLNPGKIVRAPRMDDRALFRYGPSYAPLPIPAQLDWSEWGGLAGAVEMCNNNGACRADAGVMCPSYLATRDEADVVRGRANALRLAITGQLGPEAFTSDELYGVMDLCVGCKGCRRECPTGVDMAKMKVEFLGAYRARHGMRLKDRLVAALPRLAPYASALAPLANLRDRIPGLAKLTERASGIDARRRLPQWRRDRFADDREPRPLRRTPGTRGEVVLFVDTFNRYFEVDVARAALRVLDAAGYDVVFPISSEPALGPSKRPLCCGRTYLAAGSIAEARAEAQRTIAALRPAVARGAAIVGLEPSCLLTLRDEFVSLVPGDDARALAGAALLFEEFIAREAAAGRWSLGLRALPERVAYLHGHCHQKAFGALPAVVQALRLVPQLDVKTIATSCCGMAGTFGYEREHYDVSLAMAERSLLPAVRSAPADALVVTDGVSCRQQIADGAARRAVHVAQVLDRARA
jgi:FAD/FMN-containing dehydrogenase/Fe-S oxidoreductase